MTSLPRGLNTTLIHMRIMHAPCSPSPFRPRTATPPHCCTPARSLAVLPRVLQERANTDTRTGGGTKGSSPARQTRHGRTASRLCVACNVRRTRPMCVQNVPGAVCVVCGGATFPRRTHIFGTSVVPQYVVNMQRQRGRFIFLTSFCR
jgi:hypothetical protein